MVDSLARLGWLQGYWTRNDPIINRLKACMKGTVDPLLTHCCPCSLGGRLVVPTSSKAHLAVGHVNASPLQKPLKVAQGVDVPELKGLKSYSINMGEMGETGQTSPSVSKRQPLCKILQVLSAFWNAKTPGTWCKWCTWAFTSLLLDGSSSSEEACCQSPPALASWRSA